jgi:hypothetical protein
MASTLAEFLDAMQRPAVGEDTYDLELVSDLSAHERRMAEDLLMVASQHGDSRALVTLGRLGTFRALPTIRAQVHHPTPWVRLSARRALVMIEGAPEVDAFVREALSQGTRLAKFAAVLDLARVRGSDAFGTLLGALDDNDDLVRGRALESLVMRFGLEGLTRDPHGESLLETPLATLESLLMSGLEPLWRKAAWVARSIFSELAIGKQPDDLDIVYRRTAPPGYRGVVVAAFEDEATPFDAWLIRREGGHDRRWAEAYLALQLERRSLRAVEVIRELELRSLRPTLEAAAARVDAAHPFAVAARAAAQALA